MILLIDNYDSFTFNLYQYLMELGAVCKVIRNDKISVKAIEKMNPEKIVLSPGPGTPDKAGICLSVVEHFYDKVPILGVCLGHQTIAQHFGGTIVKAPVLMHGKLSEVTHHQEGLYHQVSNPFTATRYHSLIVERESFPDCLKITSETKDGIIMGLKHREYPVEGFQFHPESIMTDAGQSLLRNFIEL